jgi:hypothetical protein
MDKKRFSCIIIPVSKQNKCSYYEIEPYTEELKHIVNTLNEKFELNLSMNSSFIHDKYGIFFMNKSDNNITNEYFNDITNKYNIEYECNNTCIVLSHRSNFDSFMKTYNIRDSEDLIHNDKNNLELYERCNKHTLCYGMLLLATKLFVEQKCTK